MFREKERGRRRLSGEEREKSAILKVKTIDMNVAINAKDHHTDKYKCTLRKTMQPVLRRGQEFMLTVTFDRGYQKEKDDLWFILSADDKPGRKNLRVKFTLDEEKTGQYVGEKDWSARVVKSADSGKEWTIAVYIPGDCVVGEWKLKIRTKLTGGRSEYLDDERPIPIIIIIIFNPWSKADQVYYAGNKQDLEEYVMNSHGVVYRGCGNYIDDVPWIYGQFETDILMICLRLLRQAFRFHMTVDMGNPVLVARALSRVVNSQDDNGVLVGNWTGDYEGGVCPGSWNSSVEILRKYRGTEPRTYEPVKYGQCWVFSHVLTTVCRALGLPCRSVTNFKSAHDCDNTCTIDYFLDVNGDVIPGMGGDSVWNFHVWNEVWMARPDCSGKGQYDGWQVIDATPQERSDGSMQCGPCPVAAVKQGKLNVCYDTGFVFSEVNAEWVQWSAGPDGEFDVISKIKTDLVGYNITTKPPNPTETDEPGTRIVQYPCVRMDITDTYKFPEGCSKEREAVRRAISYTRYGNRFFKQSKDLQVSFEAPPETKIGKDLVLTAVVTNVSCADREVAVSMAARRCQYWNNKQGSKKMNADKFPKKTIKPKQKERFCLTVTPKQYLGVLDEHMTVYGYVCARDLQTDMPYTDQDDFRLQAPKVKVEAQKAAVSGKPLTVTISFENPLSVPLTNGRIWISSDLDLAPEDTNPFEVAYGTLKLKIKDVKPKEQVCRTVRMLGKMEDDEKDTDMAINSSFECDQISALFRGGIIIRMKAH